MKTLIMLAILTLSMNAHARHGENDGNGTDDGRSIQCLDQSTGASILQFASTTGSATVSTELYDLTAKSRGDDVGEISLTDKRSGDSVRSKRLEELLKVTLTSDEATEQPQVSEVPTSRGFAETQIVSPSKDVVKVWSRSRHGESQMEVTLVTDENQAMPIRILCKVLR